MNKKDQQLDRHAIPIWAFKREDLKRRNVKSVS